MQGNDFDNSIRDLLNSNTPEFNPADWARMEDMLRNVPAADVSSGAGGSAGAGAAGSALSGMKLWLAAAVVTVGGATSVVVYNSSVKDQQVLEAVAIENNAVTDQKMQPEPYSDINRTEKSDVNQKPAGLKNKVVTDQPAGENTEKGAKVNSPAKEEIAGISPTQKHSGKVLSNSNSNSSNSGPANQTSVNNNKAGLPGGFTSVNGSGSGSGINSGVSNGISSGIPARANSLSGTTEQCPAGKKPSLPYVIAGIDTVTTLVFTLSPCEPFCLRLPGQAASGEKVRISANTAGLKGAQFELAPGTLNVGSFCWTPKADQARKEPYSLTVNLRSDNCPEIVSYNILLTVAQQNTIRIAGDTLLQPGQQGRIRVVTNFAEANYQWKPAHGLIGSSQTREIVVAPENTTDYSVTVTNAGGCPLSATYRVKIADASVTSAIFVPNIFTPNGDNLNDRFVVRGIKPGEMTLKIYNRQGKEVYQNSNYNNNWDGSGLKDGMYNYFIEQHSTGKTLKGIIEISR